MHVTYNEERACYEGLPEEWAHINQQFGIPLAQVDSLFTDRDGHLRSFFFLESRTIVVLIVRA